MELDWLDSAATAFLSPVHLEAHLVVLVDQEHQELVLEVHWLVRVAQQACQQEQVEDSEAKDLLPGEMFLALVARVTDT